MLLFSLSQTYTVTSSPSAVFTKRRLSMISYRFISWPDLDGIFYVAQAFFSCVEPCFIPVQ